MVAGITVFPASAAIEEWNPYIMTGRKIEFGTALELEEHEGTWYVAEEADNNVIAPGTVFKFLKDGDSYSVAIYRQGTDDAADRVVSIPALSYRIYQSSDKDGEFNDLDTWVMGEVDRYDTASDKYILKNIVNNRAYYGNIPNIQVVEITSLSGYNFQKGLLPGDILLRGAHTAPGFDNVYITNTDSNVTKDCSGFHVGDDGSIYDAMDRVAFQLPSNANAWLVTDRNCVREFGTNYTAKTTYEIRPYVYDYGQCTVSFEGGTKLQNGANTPDSFSLDRGDLFPSGDDKVYRYESVTIKANNANQYPFVIKYGDKTYTLEDMSVDDNGKYYLTIDNVQDDIKVIGKKVVFTGRKLIAASGVPEAMLSEAKVNDLFLPKVNFTSEKYSTVKLGNYKGFSGDSSTVIDNVQKVFFHEDGSLTIETDSSASTYSLPDGLKSWRVLKNSDGTLSLWGIEKDIDCFVSSSTMKSISVVNDFAGITSDQDDYLTYKIANDLTAPGMGICYDIVLDLNGKTMTMDSDDTDKLMIHNNITLTVKNGTIQTSGDHPMFSVEDGEHGTLYLDNVTLKNNESSSIDSLIAVENGSLDVILKNSFDFSYSNKNYLVKVDKGTIRMISDESRANDLREGVANGCYNGLTGKNTDFPFIYTFTDHQWDEHSYKYTWTPTASGYRCTATVTCANNPAHIVSEEVNAVLVTTDPTCTEPGKKLYTATFTNPAFEEQTKEDEIAATGHRWGEVTYTWNAAKTECTASRICLNDSDHVDSETVAAKELEEGLDIWVATFENPDFERQTVRGESWVMINRSDLANESAFNDASKKFYLDSNGNTSSSALTNKYIDRDLVIDLNGLFFTVEDARLAKDRTLHFIDLSEGKTGRVDISAAGTYGISSSADNKDGYSYVILDGVRVNNKGGKPAFMVEDTTALRGNLEVSVMEGTRFTFEKNYNRTIFQVYGNDARTRITVNSDVAFPDTSNYQNTPFDGQLVTQVNDGEGFRYKYILTNKINAPYVAGHALTLEDNIGVDFYVMLPDYYFNDNTEVTFEWGEGDYRKSATINGSSLTKINKTSTEQSYNCIIKCGVAARCMTDEIKMTVTYIDSEVLTDTYRVVDYAAQAAAVYGDNDSLIKLLCDMLDYGGAAQTYFKYRTNDLASSYISKVNKDWEREISPDGLGSDETSYDEDQLAVLGITFRGAAISCTDKTSLRIYLSGIDGWPNGLTFTYGDKTLTPAENNGLYYIEITDLGPADIFGKFSVTISDGGTETTLVYCTARYYNSIVSSDKDALVAFQPVIKAMYQYYKTAYKYVGSTGGEVWIR